MVTSEMESGGIAINSIYVTPFESVCYKVLYIMQNTHTHTHTHTHTVK